MREKRQSCLTTAYAVDFPWRAHSSRFQLGKDVSAALPVQRTYTLGS